VANKIGTYTVSVLAKENASRLRGRPISTVDLACAECDMIPIEQRNAREVSHIAGKQMVPDGVSIENPAFECNSGKVT